MNAKIRLGASLLAASAALVSAATASAQDATTPPPPPPPATTTAPTTTSAGDTDHARMVGHLAVGFLGVAGVPLGLGDWGKTAHPTGTNPPTPAGGTVCGQPDAPGQPSNVSCVPVLTGSTTIQSPVIGVRYWLNERLGIDAGIGFAFLSGSTTSYPYPDNIYDNSTKWDAKKDSAFAVALHGGVPLALASGRHFTFEVIPELNVGFASGTHKDQIAPAPAIPPGATPPTQRPLRDNLSLGGFLLDVGARAGGEIQFGFMGLPELALQGTVGLYFSTRSTSVSVGGKTASDSNTTIATSVQQTPFAIFTNNIAALYYF